MNSLEQLRSLGQGVPEGRLVPPPGNRRLYLVLGFLGVGVVGLFLYVNRQFLEPSVPVSVERAVAVKVSASEMQEASAGQILFQASGWIEPEPFMTKAASFVEGLVAEVRVIDGQPVERGDILAVIDDRSLKLMVAELEAELRALNGEVPVAGGRVQMAEKAVDLAEEKLAGAKAEMARLQRYSDILQKSGDTVPLLQRDDARLNAERQSKAVLEMARELELRTVEVGVAKAEAAALQQKIEARQANLARSQLDLERTVVRAPISGIVQKVLVRVGQKVMLAGDNMDSATVADLYDPRRLQVRVDVALADAGGLEVGMPARVLTDLLPGVAIAGQVTSIVGQADLTKNTLQAKVRLVEPHWRLRPEMLARVEFLPLPKKDPAPARPGPGMATVRTYVPEAALLAPQQDQATAWVVSREGRAESRPVKLGQARMDGWRELRDGVNPGEEVILSNQSRLTPGCRISRTPAESTSTPSSR